MPVSKLTSQPNDVISEVSRIVSEITGVQLGDAQRIMVQNRLRRRIIELSLSTEEAYADYLRKNNKVEIPYLISLLTTHHTFFFREYDQFEYLSKNLAGLILDLRKRNEKTLRIWSAACSRGQEVYSLSMLMAHMMPRLGSDIDYEIWGTDVDAQSVEIAKNGVYRRNEIKEIPAVYLGNHWARGTGEIADFVKAKATIRKPCRFETANLLNLKEAKIPSKFDVIFCRNVFIYFNSAQIKQITDQILKRLSREGIFFIGISETLNSLGLPVDVAGPSIYRHQKLDALKVPQLDIALVPQALAKIEKPAALKVFCIDDSPSILALLKHILSHESGFDVIGTASNGVEAAEKLLHLKPDLVTLDIHMPVQTGLEYLRKNYSTRHAPVIMISSVVREEGDLALQCLEAGAADYIEKPTVSRLAERGEEIRSKLTAAFRSRNLDGLASERRPSSYQIDRDYSRRSVISAPDQALRVIVTSVGHRVKVANLLAELKFEVQPPTFILLEGGANLVAGFAKSVARESGVEIVNDEKGLLKLSTKQVQVLDLEHAWSDLRQIYSNRSVSILVFGDVTGATRVLLQKWMDSQILVEDLGHEWSQSPLAKLATDIVPSTSFGYMSTHYLSECLDKVKKGA